MDKANRDDDSSPSPRRRKSLHIDMHVEADLRAVKYVDRTPQSESNLRTYVSKNHSSHELDPFGEAQLDCASPQGRFSSELKEKKYGSPFNSQRDKEESIREEGEGLHPESMFCKISIFIFILLSVCFCSFAIYLLISSWKSAAAPTMDEYNAYLHTFKKNISSDEERRTNYEYFKQNVAYIKKISASGE